MRRGADADIPGSRAALERVGAARNVYALLVMAVVSALLFVFGLIGSKESASWLDEIPESAVFMVIGIAGFALFFPWFTALYFARHLLYSVKELERRLAAIEETTNPAP